MELHHEINKKEQPDKVIYNITNIKQPITKKEQKRSHKHTQTTINNQHNKHKQTNTSQTIQIPHTQTKSPPKKRTPPQQHRIKTTILKIPTTLTSHTFQNNTQQTTHRNKTQQK